ncbi:D-alanine--D-alanyl carrier protein ligase [Pseudoalteromonas holothuriae]|uniref:D-alanine--D-alanyl carrier protein ligase n=1 Tax=Pseudoalteromonas holothuriae TaxID=2963714 RepID=A0ABM9GJI4_9GAMM|nr:non-ribosomal peptide synthetase [Pseudoalteromonas sp. CIP111951]CAH9057846.1 D-alanine--D-alanyl carrier protein ligase [Pseudoalteromonas sp. CIP111951]
MQKNIEQILGLTSVQKGMLIESIRSEGNSVYSAHLRLSLVGDLSQDALQHAIKQLVKTHQTLRSVFRWERIKEPVQVIVKNIDIPCSIFDLSTETQREQARQANEIVKSDRAAAFDIRQNCIRFSLIKLGANQYELLVCNHHIILDGWSNALLLESLFDFYYEALTGSSRKTTKLHTDLLEKYRKHELAALNNPNSVEYWNQVVADLPEENRLSIRGVNTGSVTGYTSQTCALNKQKIDELACLFKVTPSTILFGCWGLLLRGYNNSDDVCFGTAVSNRVNLPTELSAVITMGVQTVPLRLNISSTESLADYFAYVQTCVNGALSNQPVDLNKLMRANGICSESALFDTLFTVENYPLDEQVVLRNTGLELSKVDNWELNHYPMSATAQLFEQYKLEFNYDQSQFNDTLVTTLLSNFSFIVENLFGQPVRKLNEIGLLDKGSQHTLISQINPRYIEPSWNGSVIDHFELAAKKFADHIALEQDNELITYQMLDTYANQIAQQIVSSENYVSQQAVVIYLPNSITLIAAMLACWKANVVYVPVDAVSPPSRAEQIVQECDAKIVMSDRTLEVPSGVEFWPLSVVKQNLNKVLQAPQRNNAPQDLLYILFTSGSTGKPKGVMISHAACMSFCRAFAEVAKIQPQDKVLSLTGIAFDVYFGETLVPLLAGASIQLIDKQQTMQGEGVAGILNSQDYAMLQATPSRLSMILLQARTAQSQSKLQKLMLAGEALPTETARQAQAYFGEQCQIVNLYGPTEASVYATWQNYNPQQRVNIGHGMENVKAFVIDRNGQLQPPFVRGEIALAGQALADGYLNMAKKTAESFIAGTFLNEQKIYLTGDIARVIEDGEIDILGRKDDQIKLRGYRIELGEIEQSLQALAQVKAALVRVYNTAQGVQQLIAYVVTAEPEAVQIEQAVRSELALTLPDYMIPNVFFFLPHWPLNTSGKVDKKALPVPNQAEVTSQYVAPSTFLEHEVQVCFATVLGVAQEQVCITANFFEVGGHSLAAMKVAADISKRLDVDVSLQYVFEYSSVELLAQKIKKLPNYQKGMVISVRNNSAEQQASFAQQRIWFIDRLMGTVQYNMPIAFDIKGHFNILAAEFALQQVIMQQPALRTTITEQGGKIVPVVRESAAFKIAEYGVASALSDSQIEQIITQQSAEPFNLSSDLMLRASYLKGEANHQVLVLVVHHIAFDGWSEALLMRAFTDFYNGFIQGEQLVGLPAGVQYADYAYWEQTTWTKSREYKAQLDYWQQQLVDLPDTHSLELDFERPNVKQNVGQAISTRLHQTQFKALCDYAQSHTMTPFMFFQGLFALYISVQSNSKKVAIGTVIANRTQSELHDIIGFFANTLILKNSSAQSSFKDYLHHIKEVNLKAQANQGAPFEQVIEQSNATRDPAYTPLFQILFLLEQPSTQSIELSDASLTSMTANTRISKFDLEVTLRLENEQAEIEWLYDCALFTQSRIERYANEFIALLNSVLDGSLVENWQSISQFEAADFMPAMIANKPQHVAPQNLLQQSLVDIWAKTLNLPAHDLGIEDNFFQLGGHSLLAIQLLSGIQDTLNMTLDMSTFYATPTIRSCAENLCATDDNSELVAVTRSDDEQYFSVSFAQQRLWFLHKMRPDSNEYSMSVGFKLYGEFNLEAAQHAMLDVINKHEILRTTYLQDKERLVQCIQHIQHIQQYTFDFIDLTGVPVVEQCDVLTASQAQFFARRFDLSQDLMINSCFISVGQSQGVLLFNVHHIAADGHSIGIFLREFSEYYSAYAQGKQSQFVPLDLQYVDYANWQQNWIGSEQYNQQTRYWQDALENAPSVHRLPLSAERDSQNVSIAKSLQVVGSASLYDKLNEKAKELGVTPFMWCHAVFSLALIEVSKVDDIVIGTPVSGRKWTALNDQIGLFVNTLALRTTTKGCNTFAEYLNDVKGVNIDALSHQDLPFDRLLDLCQVSRSSLYTPLFQILFTMNDVPLSNLNLWGIDAEVTLPQEEAAKFDLSLDISANSQHMYWQWTYDATIFDQGTIEQLAQRTNMLLQQSLLKTDTELRLLVDNYEQLVAHQHTVPEDDEFIAANTAQACMLSNLWANLLGRSETEISIKHNFFALGGNSLQAVQFVSEVFKAYGKEISVAAFYDRPTIEHCLELLALQSHSHEALVITKSTVLPEPSFAQQRMWFLDQLTVQPLYNMASKFAVTGPFNIEVASAALHQLVQRHSVLRSQFMKTETGLQVHVLKSLVPVITEHNLMSLEPAEQQNQLELLERANKSIHFELQSAPLFKCDFCRLTAQQGILLFNMHHIISDGLSVDIMFKEFVAHYERLLSAEIQALPPLKLQYSDFVQWQKQWISQARAAKQLTYWQTQLADAPAVHGITLDFPRPQVKSHQAHCHSVTLPLSTKNTLALVAERLGVTEFVFLHSVLSYVLARHSNSQEVLIGTPVAGRRHPDLMLLIGLFVNTVALRTNLSGCQTFSEYTAHVKAVNGAAQENQDIPFEQVVEHCKVPRSAHYTPVFQIMMTMRGESQSQQVGDIHFKQLDESEAVAKFDLSIDIALDERGITWNWLFDADLFAQKHVIQMSTHVLKVLEQVLATPEMAIAEIVMLSSEEIHQLTAWGNTPPMLSEQDSIQTRFNRQVLSSPDSLAVITDHMQLTYQQLDTLSDKLAGVICQAINGQHDTRLAEGTLVSLYQQRTIEFVISILAIVKAGGAYVPITVDTSAQRLNQLLQDCKCPVLLTQHDLQDKLDTLLLTYSEQRAVDILVVDLDELKAMPAGRVMDFDAQQSDLLYVNYTSGTTGLPKGVMIEQAGVIRLVDQPFLAMDQDTVTVQISSLAFDAATFEIWGALLNGGRCVLYTHPYMDLMLLNQVLIEHQVTHTFITAGLFRRWANELIDNQRSFALRVVLSGGDIVSPQSVYQVQSVIPKAQVFNCYGPTENTTFTTYYAVPALSQGSDKPLPIGVPLQGDSLYVMSGDLQLQPSGVVGELLVGGGLARGYLHQQALSNEKFVQVNGLSDNGERLYRTGDLVRFNNQGLLEFIGRDDQQLKIRGFRVELGEIAAGIEQFQQVSQVYVVAERPDAAEPRLVAYIVPKLAAQVEPALELDDADNGTVAQYKMNDFAKQWLDMLKHSIASALPSYMVPHDYVMLVELPITQNGKVDTKRLPCAQQAQSAVYLAKPQTDLERKVAQYWAQVLKIDVQNIGRDSNFFALGGHSLSMISLSALLQAHLHLEVSVSELYNHAELSSMASLLSSAQQQSWSAIPVISPEANGYEVSPAQQRLWFIDKLGQQKGAYNIPVAFDVSGELDLAAVTSALEIIFARHPVLRTVYREVEQGVRQHVIPMSDVHCQMQPVALDSPLDLQDTLAHLATLSFELASDLMLRAYYVTLSTGVDTPARGCLILNMHHIAVDGWSVALLTKEFSECYVLLSQGATKEQIFEQLPTTSISYGDYAHWINSSEQQSQIADQISYWQSQLADAPSVHGLPLKGYRPDIKKTQGARITSSITKALSAQLADFAQQNNMTIFMLMHAMVSLLLARHSGSSDVIVGTPTANRGHEQTKDLVGLFVNTLVLRVNTNTRSLQDFFRHVKAVNIAAQAHQGVPFEQLVDALDITRSQSLSPVFQIMLDMNTNEQADVTLPHIELTPCHDSVFPVQSKFDLHISVVQSQGQLNIHWVFDTALFDSTYIEQLDTHLHNLLVAVSSTTVDDITSLAMLSSAEVDYLLTELNQSGDISTSLCLHQLFESQVAKSPSAQSVHAGDITLTYAQLDQQATNLGAYLISQNVKAGDVVGICMRRSEKTIIAILAILKAGAAYVPLDPSYPKARIEYILSDVKPALLFVDQATEHSFDFANFNVANIEQIPEQLVSTELDVLYDVEQLAYIIYTSGSTGKPKGVMISHRNASAMLAWANDYFSCAEKSRVLASTSLNFDLSIFEIFLPLSSGGTCVVVDNILSLLEPQNAVLEVSLINTVPSGINALLQEHAVPASVIAVNLAGEPLQANTVNRLLDIFSVQRVVNLYGPSEDTTYSTYYSMTSQVASNPLIGKPISSTQAFVLDVNQQLVPFGCVGELYLSGEGVSLGYLNQPDLTAKNYLDNPYQPGSKMYKTGDLVKYTAQGELVYLGRLDDQVKVNGFRIELGEIEFHLLQLDWVKACLVKVEEDSTRTILVAYVEVSSEQALDCKQQVRAYLADCLPKHMVPNVIVTIDEWPLLPNGKIDKQHLPSWNIARVTVKPETKTELVISDIWQSLLSMQGEVLDAEQSFFSLGGNSLLAVKLNGLIQKQLGIDIGLAQLFELQSIQQQAQEVDRVLVSGKPTQDIVPLQHDVNRPLAPTQRRLWFLSQLSEQSTEYNMCTAYEYHTAIEPKLLKHAVEELIERHEPLQANYHMVDLQPMWYLNKKQNLIFNVVDLSGLSASECETQWRDMLASEFTHVFDLSKGPLVRVSLVKTGPESGKLIFNVHHIGFDGWSMHIVERELQVLYGTQLNATPADLPALPVSYSDYVSWRNDFEQSDAYLQQVEYWLAHLADAAPLHSLPIQFERPQVKCNKASITRSVINTEQKAGLVALCSSLQVTQFMLTHALVSLLIARHSNNHDVLLLTPIANREQQAVADLVGFFTNTLILRSSTEFDGFAEFIAHIKACNIAAQRNQQVPFEYLVEQLNLPRSTAFTPLAQLMLNFIEASEPASSGTMSLQRIAQAESAKFDLEIRVENHASGWDIDWVYDEALFSSDYIDELSTDFSQLVDNLLTLQGDITGLALAQLSLYDGKTQAELKAGFEGPTQLLSHSTIHSFVEQTAIETPTQVALKSANGELLSYLELNQLANKISHSLLALGVNKADIIAMSLPRGVEQIALLLGILKAGATYLPIDMQLPQSRIRHILTCSAARFWVKECAQDISIADWSGRDITTSELINNINSHNPEILIEPKDPAYLLFTSGSSGLPKGVIQTHQTIVNLVETSGLTQPYLGLQFTPITFDVSIQELATAWHTGASLLLITEQQKQELVDIQALIELHQVRRLFVPPAVFDIIAQQYLEHKESITSLMEVIVAGEQLVLSDAIRVFLERNPHCQLWNHYGPTETHVVTTYSVHSRANCTPPIGRVLANTRAYVVGLHQQLLPIGSKGELWISGVSVALGYIGNEQQNAEGFIVLDDGSHCYNTGDTVVFDGHDFTYFGRQDRQVQIRGFRVELADIESHLRQLTGVAQAHVMYMDVVGRKMLVAYIEHTHGLNNLDELTVLSKQHLPVYMHPDAWVEVSEWPLNINGKLNARALPAPDFAVEALVTPTTPTEQLLAQMWSDLLSQSSDHIGIDSNFFEIGGHSLLVVKLVAQVRVAFQVELNVRDIFANPSIREQAQMIDLSNAKQAALEAVAKSDNIIEMEI